MNFRRVERVQRHGDLNNVEIRHSKQLRARLDKLPFLNVNFTEHSGKRSVHVSVSDFDRRQLDFCFERQNLLFQRLFLSRKQRRLILQSQQCAVIPVVFEPSLRERAVGDDLPCEVRFGPVVFGFGVLFILLGLLDQPAVVRLLASEQILLSLGFGERVLRLSFPLDINFRVNSQERIEWLTFRTRGAGNERPDFEQRADLDDLATDLCRVLDFPVRDDGAEAGNDLAQIRGLDFKDSHVEDLSRRFFRLRFFSECREPRENPAPGRNDSGTDGDVEKNVTLTLSHGPAWRKTKRDAVTVLDKSRSLYRRPRTAQRDHSRFAGESDFQF